jgi:hypothetical protein
MLELITFYRGGERGKKEGHSNGEFDYHYNIKHPADSSVTNDVPSLRQFIEVSIHHNSD